ncbi:hypothetical protein U1Q18_040463 [Sarracenia purpurea var. burkii]
MDDALDCRPVSANRDLQIDARSCIVSGAHDLLVKMPKQELMSKVSATIPGAGKQGQIDELMPKGMSGGSLGTTEEQEVAARIKALKGILKLGQVWLHPMACPDLLPGA